MIHLTKIQFSSLSEGALFVIFGKTINEQTHRQIQNATTLLQQQPFAGLIEIVPSYTNLCIYYNPLKVAQSLKLLPGKTTAEKVQYYVSSLLTQPNESALNVSRLVEIPVIYGGEYGPDLAYVAQVNRLTPEQVIDIHTSGDYLVYMLGFAPGFPFLGGLDERIATARRSTPRLEIAKGSVGIAGKQTGVYPLATPGGWQIIGRTQSPLFLPEQIPPTLLRAGDRIRFVAVKEDGSC